MSTTTTDGTNEASSAAYVPPKVWVDTSEKDSMNKPTAGPRFEKELPVGSHPIQLYSLATPNGVKITILLEELLALGIAEAEYDAWLVHIMKHDQFGSGFCAINPNSKIPAMTIVDPSDATKTISLFESGSILLHLAERFQQFLPKDPPGRAATLNWLFWQMGSAPYLGGGFGHFYQYAPVKLEYPVNRYTMETKRQLDVLERQLTGSKYIASDDYTIADMAIWPWYGVLVLGGLYGDAATFLSVEEYPNVSRWAQEIAARPAVKRGRLVNKAWDAEHEQVPERHSAKDIDDVLAKAPPQEEEQS